MKNALLARILQESFKILQDNALCLDSLKDSCKILAWNAFVVYFLNTAQIHFADLYLRGFHEVAYMVPSYQSISVHFHSRSLNPCFPYVSVHKNGMNVSMDSYGTIFQR